MNEPLTLETAQARVREVEAQVTAQRAVVDKAIRERRSAREEAATLTILQASLEAHRRELAAIT
jgi:hypothetical protein